MFSPVQANGMPPRKKLSKAKLRALEAQQGQPRKSGKMRRMSAMTDDGGRASRKRQMDDAGGFRACGSIIFALSIVQSIMLSYIQTSCSHYIYLQC